jgi:hypothetical protein
MFDYHPDDPYCVVKLFDIQWSMPAHCWMDSARTGHRPRVRIATIGNLAPGCAIYGCCDSCGRSAKLNLIDRTPVQKTPRPSSFSLWILLLSGASMWGEHATHRTDVGEAGLESLLNNEVLIEQDDDGSVWARYSLNPAALIARGVGLGGAQDALPDLYLERIPLRLK